MPMTLARDGNEALSADLRDEVATLELGARLAGALQPGLRIYLQGELGAGKTTLVRGMLRALGYRGRVKSPTFTLLETYKVSSLYLYHFDLYRFKWPEEWRDAGFRDALGGEAVCVVEWPDKAQGELPPADVVVTLEHAGSGRTARIAAMSDRGQRCLDVLTE